MKRFYLFFMFCCIVLSLAAQNSIEFLGMPIRGNTKTAFAKTLKEKGYKYDWGKDGFVWYRGQFAGYDADVILIPMGEDDGIRGVQVSLKDLNPIKFGQLFSDLVRKYMAKYPNFKYSNDITTEGTSVMFSKFMEDGLMDCIILKSSVEGTSLEFRISYYVCLNEKDEDKASDNSKGIDLDDL